MVPAVEGQWKMAVVERAQVSMPGVEKAVMVASVLVTARSENVALIVIAANRELTATVVVIVLIASIAMNTQH